MTGGCTGSGGALVLQVVLGGTHTPVWAAAAAWVFSLQGGLGAGGSHLAGVTWEPHVLAGVGPPSPGRGLA